MVKPRDKFLNRLLLFFTVFGFASVFSGIASFDIPIDLGRMNASPSEQLPLGADSLGRNLILVFAQVFLGSVLQIFAAASFGILCAQKSFLLSSKLYDSKPKVFEPFHRFTGSLVQVSEFIPFVVFILLFALLLKEISNHAMLLVFFFFAWMLFYNRLVSQLNSVMRKPYWKAHEAMGGTLDDRCLKYGINCGWSSELSLFAIFILQSFFLAEACLAYLGFGFQEPLSSLGNAIAEHYHVFLRGESRVVLLCSGFIMLILSLPKVVSILIGLIVHLPKLRKSTPVLTEPNTEGTEPTTI